MDRLDDLLRMALTEDMPHGDVTTDSVVDPSVRGGAVVFAREPFVLSGSRLFRRVFHLVDQEIEIEDSFEDGTAIGPDDPVFRLRGRYASLLRGERTALNLLQRLSGIATITRRMVDAIAGTRCKLLDTRKTTPLWRLAEKCAVRDGGGRNHRFGLSDGILIKDNHIAAVGGVGEAVRRARRNAPHPLKVEVEVENLGELDEALEAGADVILLDNFSVDLLSAAVRRTAGRALLEASGGVTLETVRAIADTGVDFVSCGALTHSARAIDLTMEFRLG